MGAETSGGRGTAFGVAGRRRQSSGESALRAPDRRASGTGVDQRPVLRGRHAEGMALHRRRLSAGGEVAEGPQVPQAHMRRLGPLSEIVAALADTGRLMVRIDETIAQHGGWPAAFQPTAEAVDARVIPFPLRVVEPPPEERYVTCVPLIPLEAAAGAFSDRQYVDEAGGFEWVAVESRHRLRPGMFVAQVAGRSMGPYPTAHIVCSARLWKAPVRVRPASSSSLTTVSPRRTSVTRESAILARKPLPMILGATRAYNFTPSIASSSRSSSRASTRAICRSWRK